MILFTKAAIALHNYLRTEESSAYCPTGFVDGEDGSGNVISGSWREEEPGTGLTLLGSVSGNGLVFSYIRHSHGIITYTFLGIHGVLVMLEISLLLIL